MQTDSSTGNPRPFRARNAQDIGVAIKHFRTQAGLTQADLAERAGIHRSYLAALENGRVTEALDRVMTLFRELGVHISIIGED